MKVVEYNEVENYHKCVDEQGRTYRIDFMRGGGQKS